MDGGAAQPFLEKHHHERRSFVEDFGAESKTLWMISGPAIFTYICQYSLGALTQTFTGQVGELELAAVSVENSVIAGLVFGAMVKKKKNGFCCLFLSCFSGVFLNYCGFCRLKKAICFDKSELGLDDIFSNGIGK